MIHKKCPFCAARISLAAAFKQFSTMQNSIMASEIRFRLIVFIVLSLGSLVLVEIALLNQPYNAFEDDAYWLVPSLAQDMSSGLSWAEQFSRDVNERGATSLNILLRLLYLTFGQNISIYMLAGIFLHTLCSYFLFIALRECKADRRLSLIASLLFLFCSLHFHAYFWIIGLQHVLAVSSILLTFIATNRVMRLCMARDALLVTAWHYLALFLTMAVLSINRASILINVVVVTLLYTYYRFVHVAHRGRSTSTVSSLNKVYMLNMLTIAAYSLYQLSYAREGIQVAQFVHPFSFGVSDQADRSISLITSLFVGYALTVLLLIGVINLIANKMPSYVSLRITRIMYFFAVVLAVTCALIFDHHLSITTSLLENLFYIVPSDSIMERWAPLVAHGLQPHKFDVIFKKILPVFLLVLFIYATPKSRKLQVLFTIFLIIDAVGYAYLSSMSLTNMPSRYAYYFTPSIILLLVFASERFLKEHFSANRNKMIILLCIFFVATNIAMTRKRLEQSSINALFSTFYTYASFALAGSLSNWIKETGHVGDIKIYISELENKRWPPLVAAFIPPHTSEFYPLYFSTQAYLSQMLHDNKIRIRVVTDTPDVFLCKDWLCDNAHNLLRTNVTQCTKVSLFMNSNQPDISLYGSADHCINARTLNNVLRYYSGFFEIHEDNDTFSSLASRKLLSRMNSFNPVLDRRQSGDLNLDHHIETNAK